MGKCIIAQERSPNSSESVEGNKIKKNNMQNIKTAKIALIQNEPCRFFILLISND